MTLLLDGLKVRYGPLEALHGVRLEAPTGSVTAVLGRNGAGKTSLMRAVAGTARVSAGRVLWQGTEITREAPGRRAALGVLLIPDEGGVFRTLSVRENLELFAGAAGRRRKDHPFGGTATPATSHSLELGVPQPGHISAALEAFPPLRDLLDRRVSLLSGGEQQMLALSRALLTPWSLLLVDELSHGLAPALASRLYAVLGALVAGSGGGVGGGSAAARTVVLAEPHPREALALADHVHILRHGDVVFSGGPSGLDPDSL